MAIFHMHCRMHMCAFNVVVIHFSWPVCFPFQSVVSGESQKKKIAKQKKGGVIQLPISMDFSSNSLVLASNFKLNLKFLYTGMCLGTSR